jgi:hypothetical protein
MAIVLDGNNLLTTGVLNSMTAQNASGTSVNFTDIPVGVKRVTIMLDSVSTDGSSDLFMQIGSGGSIDTSANYTRVSGYYGTSASVTGGTTETGFRMTWGSGATNIHTGSGTLCLIGSNTWIFDFSWIDHINPTYLSKVVGRKSLSGPLNRFRLTTVSGSPSFDAGTVNLFYE